ncbi:AraC family transcriptional regulator [Vibrio sp. PP-XX7]
MEAYEWPGNVAQLHSVLLSLASLSKAEITVDDIAGFGVIPSASPRSHIIDCLLDHQLDGFMDYHPALFKALQFLSQNFQEDITLTQMAGASYTSASHLSYLFREHLGQSFKSLLCQLRVKFAQHLIRCSSPRQNHRCVYEFWIWGSQPFRKNVQTICRMYAAAISSRTASRTASRSASGPA